MQLNTYLQQHGHGSATELARAIGGHVGDVVQWAKGARPVPIGRAVQIETATAGAVTRRDLRADWADIWPELASAAPGTTTPPLN